MTIWTTGILFKAIEKHIADTNDKALKESYQNMQEVKQEQESGANKGK